MFFYKLWWGKWWSGVHKLATLKIYAEELPEKGPYNSVHLGKLKQLDQMVSDLDDFERKSGTIVYLTMVLRERAMAALPENTAELLRAKNMSSEVALELVRRDITEYSRLSAALYGATAEYLEKDPVLKNIHDRLAMTVELHGVLTLAGILPEEKEWAQTLVDTFVDLRREMGTDSPVKGLTNTFDNPPTLTEIRIIEELFAIGEGAPPIRAQVLAFRMTLDVADELETRRIYDASQMTEADRRTLLFLAQERVREAEDAEGGEEDEDSKPGVTTPAFQAIAAQAQARTEPPEIRSRAIPALAGVAASAAAKAVLPKLISGASKLTAATSGGSSSLTSLGKNLSAMKANAGSSSTAGAKSGLVPSSVGAKLDKFSSTVNSATGAVQSVKGLVNELTPDVEAQVAAIEQEKARLNQSLDTVRHELEKVQVSADLADNLETAQAALARAKDEVAPDPGFGARIAAGSSAAIQQALIEQRLTLGGTPLGLGSYASNEELVAKVSGGLAQYGLNFFPTTEDIVIKPYAPILEPPSFVDMTGAVNPFEARVQKTTSQTKAASFLNTSSNAGISVAQTVTRSEGTSGSGSIGFGGFGVSVSGSNSSATSNTNNQTLSTASMMSAASETSERVKQTARQEERGGGGGFIGIGARAATSFGQTTSTGVATVSGRASAEGSSEATETAQYESYIRVVGPNMPTPETFAEALFTDTSTWALTDRGRLEAMVPVTVLLKQAASQIVVLPTSNVDKELKKKFEIAILFVEAAWRRRAKFWGFLLQDRPEFDVPTPVLNLIRSAFPSSLGRVPNLLDALLGSLIVRHRETVLDSNGGVDSNLFSLEVKRLASSIKNASKTAEKSSNSFPVELPFLDAEGLEKQVTKEIVTLLEANESSFAAVGLTYDGESAAFEVAAEVIEVSNPETLWNNAIAAEAQATTTKWEDLEEWQRRWIQQTIEQQGKWSPEQYELFQRRFFSEDQSSDFIEALRGLIEDEYEPAKPSHYLTVTLSKAEEKEQALQRAVSRMFKADWVVMAGLWLDDENGTPDAMDEFGPEGDALWTRLVNGVALFEDADDARKAVDEFVANDEDYQEYQSEVDALNDDGDLDEDARNAALAALNEQYEAALRALSLIEDEYEPAKPSHYLTVTLSKAEEKEQALQRAVSRMFKADWVVMAGLWLDDENGIPDAMDELGPEGDALWTRLVNGVTLFEDADDARKAVEDFKANDADYQEYQSEVDAMNVDGNLDEDGRNAALAALNEQYEAVLRALSDLEAARQAAEFKYDSNFPQE
eukprot:g15208.t1